MGSWCFEHFKCYRCLLKQAISKDLLWPKIFNANLIFTKMNGPVKMNKTLWNNDFATDLPRNQESCVSMRLIWKILHKYADTTFQLHEKRLMRNEIYCVVLSQTNCIIITIAFIFSSYGETNYVEGHMAPQIISFKHLCNMSRKNKVGWAVPSSGHT